MTGSNETPITPAILPVPPVTPPAVPANLRLGQGNYIYWNAIVRPFLNAHRLFGYIDGTYACPDQSLLTSGSAVPKPNPAYLTWKQNDDGVVALLLQTLSESAIGVIIGYNTSAKIWQVLEHTYASASHPGISGLRRNFLSLKQTDEPVTEFLLRAKRLSDSLAAVGQHVSQIDFNTTIFTGLRDEYKDLSTSLMTRPEPVSFEELYDFLAQHDLVHGKDLTATPQAFLSTAGALSEPSSAHVSAGVTAAQAAFLQAILPAFQGLGLGHLLTPSLSSTGHSAGNTNSNGQQSHNGNGGRGGQHNRGGRGCGDRNNNSGGGNYTGGCTSKGGNTLWGLCCQICNGWNHYAQQCSHRYYAPAAHSSVPRMSVSPSAPSSSQWFPDTGATNHVTPDIAGLEYAESYQGADSLHIGSVSLQMPKNRSSTSSSSNRRKPYPRSHADDQKSKPPILPIRNENEWAEFKCPICIEHPHNAVLLQCSSSETGCHPYICNTGSRQSNCLDRFRKSVGPGGQLVCPLCRGKISGWTVVKPARRFMNSKTRGCSVETCDFAGSYSQLKKHASREHLNLRPTMVDSRLELEWRRLEEDMEQLNRLNMQSEFDDDDDEDDFFADGANDLDVDEDDGFVDGSYILDDDEDDGFADGVDELDVDDDGFVGNANDLDVDEDDTLVNGTNDLDDHEDDGLVDGSYDLDVDEDDLFADGANDLDDHVDDGFVYGACDLDDDEDDGFVDGAYDLDDHVDDGCDLDDDDDEDDGFVDDDYDYDLDDNEDDGFVDDDYDLDDDEGFMD